MWHWDSWGMMGPFGWIFGLLLLVLLALGVIYLWRALDLGSSPKQDGGDKPQSRDKALEIARERYAKGEISKEEFEELKRDLS